MTRHCNIDINAVGFPIFSKSLSANPSSKPNLCVAITFQAYIIPTYDEMNKIFNKAEQGLVGNVVSKKLTNVSVSRGKTAWPKAEKDLTNFGIRFDFDGEVTQNGVVYNKFQVQPNAGKVPSSVQQWRENNGGTHAVMGSMLVKKGGTKDDVKQAFSQFQDAFKK